MRHILQILAVAILVCAGSPAALCQTDVDGITKDLDMAESLLKKAESGFDEAVCQKVESWLDSDQRQRSFNDFAAKLDEDKLFERMQSGTKLEEDVGVLAELHRKIEAIESAVKTSVAKAREAADNACSAAEKTALKPDQKKWLSENARNLSVLAHGLAGEVPANLDALTKRFGASIAVDMGVFGSRERASILRDIENFPQLSAFAHSCGLSDDRGSPIDLINLSARLSNAKLAQDWMRRNEGIDGAIARSSADSGMREEWERRMADYDARLRPLASCNYNVTQARDACNQFADDNLGNRVGAFMSELADRFVVAQNGIRRMAANIATLLKQAEEAQTKAKGCADKAKTESATKEAEQCAPLLAQLEVARGHFAKKQGLAATKKELDSIQTKLDAMDADACPDVRERVNKGVSQVTRMGEGLRRVQQDLSKCQPDTLKRRAEQLSQKEHVWLKSLGERARLSVAVAEYYQKANAAYFAGELQRAQEFYKEALRQAEIAGRPTCINIVDRINNNLTKIAAVEKQKDWIDKVASNCNVPQIRSELSNLASKAKVKFQYRMMDQLHEAMDTCQASQDQGVSEAQENQEADDRQSVCTNDYGEGYVVGHILDDGRFFCKPTKATADAVCVEKNQPGYYAANIDTRGGFACLPTKQTATAWCNSHNPGSGWYAGAIKSDGRFSCNKKVARTKPGTRKGGTRRPQPSYDPQAAAAAAAAVGVVIQNLQRNGGGRAPAQRRCHRNPNTGQLHCGSN